MGIRHGKEEEEGEYKNLFTLISFTKKVDARHGMREIFESSRQGALVVYRGGKKKPKA